MSIACTVAAKDIEALKTFDTPTIANALETLNLPEISSAGPSIRALTPVAAPLVGIAVTATMSEIRGGKFEHLENWLRFL